VRRAHHAKMEEGRKREVWRSRKNRRAFESEETAAAPFGGREKPERTVSGGKTLRVYTQVGPAGGRRNRLVILLASPKITRCRFGSGRSARFPPHLAGRQPPLTNMVF
jgi:hypothetical protein